MSFNFIDVDELYVDVYQFLHHLCDISSFTYIHLSILIRWRGEAVDTYLVREKWQTGYHHCYHHHHHCHEDLAASLQQKPALQSTCNHLVFTRHQVKRKTLLT